MTTICLNTLIGCPASGKSTFCHRIRSEAQRFNVLHICYDDFIRMPAFDSTVPEATAAATHYFQSKRYKKDRFSMLWLLQQLIDDIKGMTSTITRTDFVKFRRAIASDFPHVDVPHVTAKFTASSATNDRYLLLIDDTMHYRSMRKEIRTLARDNELAHFVTFCHTTLAGAIERNRNRCGAAGSGADVDVNHLKRMYARIEAPTTAEDGEILHFTIDNDVAAAAASDHRITADFVESFALQCCAAPLKAVGKSVDHPPVVVVEQTVLHRIDLILRRSVNRKMKNHQQRASGGDDDTTMVDLGELAKLLCAKRCFVLNEIKLGRMELPECLDDLSSSID